MSNTPRTDAAKFFSDIGGWVTPASKFMELERELAAANSKIEALNRGNANAERILCDLTGCESGRDIPDWIVAAKNRIKRLEEAGDKMFPWSERVGQEFWTEAKEAKP
jgi:hypothetical protein